MRLGFELSKEEQTVITEIPEGRLSAVSSRVIALRLGIAERRARQIIRHLIDHHHCCIGSATDNPVGFYFITDPGELADVIGALRHRGISILVRASKLSGNSLEEIFRQGRLELEFERECRAEAKAQ